MTEGEEARLPCIAVGFPPPVISWIQDGRSMLTTGGRYLIHESGTLIINAIQVRMLAWSVMKDELKRKDKCIEETGNSSASVKEKIDCIFIF